MDFRMDGFNLSIPSIRVLTRGVEMEGRSQVVRVGCAMNEFMA
jgi:hypothetical protein